MRPTSAARPVNRIPFVDEEVPGKEVAASDLLVFAMEGLAPEQENVDVSLQEARERVQRLLQPEDVHQTSVQKHASIWASSVAAQQPAAAALADLASSLGRVGYGARVVAVKFWRNLSHSFVAVRAGFNEYVVDPTFADQFTVAAPTPRFAALLRALPPVLVATPERAARVGAIASFELARLFRHQGGELPPWRRADHVASKWDVARAATVAPAAQPNLSLAGKAGVLEGGSPSTDGDSPRSVLPRAARRFAPTTRTLGFTLAGAADQGVCWGSGDQCVCGGPGDQCVCWGLRQVLAAALGLYGLQAAAARPQAGLRAGPPEGAAAAA